MWRTYCSTQKEKLSKMLRKYLFLLFAITVALSATADDTSNAVQARKLFDHTYNMVFGEQGSTLHYSVNLIGIMKVSGTIWYKGKKSRFAESRYLSWCDGVKDFWVDEKKKTVTLYDANSEKKDKYGRPKGIGNFIRNTSLDEFPQFYNVLKGDMSLVGTRPPTVDEWNHYDPHHRIRMSTKPGITGMWQVSGRSKITDFEQVVALDKMYIEHWSIWLDFRILAKTVQVVLKHEGAS